MGSIAKNNKFTIQEEFAISAGAGSGKTYTLSRRYINALLGFDFFVEDEKQHNYIENKNNKAASIDKIITMTYTEAAALEMKERIFGLIQKILDFEKLEVKDGDYKSIEIGMKKLNDDEKAYVENTLKLAQKNSNNAFISTIHSFCLNTLKAHSDVARIDPRLSIINDDEKDKILSQVQIQTMTKEDALTFKVFENIDKFKVTQLSTKYATNSKFRESLDKFMVNSINVNTLKNMIFELFPFPEATSEIYDEIESAKDSQVRREWFEQYLSNFEKFEAQPWNSFKHDGKALGLGAKTYPFLDPFVKSYDNLVEVYSSPNSDLETKFTSNLKELHTLLQKVYQNYTEALNEENKIDFDAIIAKTAEVIKKVSTDYKYIMVDEFQDTNGLQLEIVNHIAKNKNLFLVGDGKQSIYSFQGAEIEVFNTAVGELTKVPMNKNFRSDKQILKFVNDVFQTLFEPQDKKALIKANYKATFEDSDKLDPSSEDKADGGVEFLISHEENKDTQENQWKNIAKFIKAIKDDKIDGYEEVKAKLKKDEKAIGIVFDSKSKMLELKKELNALGLACKVSATENFYHTKEVNDIFLVLKSCEILNRKNKQLKIKNAKAPTLSSNDKFYIAGALRSNIVQYDEKKILEVFESEIENIIKVFNMYIAKLNSSKISETIKYIVDGSNLLETYLYIGDIAQRAANIEKLIQDAIVYEQNIPNDLFTYLSDLERNIYFLKDIKEDEAFYQSSNVESIEICTIHSTKGLAYPMVILAQSEKGLHANASGEMGLSFNSFAINEQGNTNDYSAIGFKIDEYEPLIYRVLKKISKNKHEAEKKRLLYVALTRAEHNLIISGSMYDKEGEPTKKNPEPDRIVADISDNSYLGWITNEVFNLEKNNIFNRVENEHIKYIDTNKFKDISGKTVNPLQFPAEEYKEQNVVFKQYNKKTASNSGQDHKANEQLAAQAKIGTAIHSILERFWDKLENQNIVDKIYLKYKILDIDSQQKIQKYLDNFKTTSTYTALKSGAEHHFELELNKIQDDKWTQGIIDLVYFDKKKDGWVIVDFKSNNVQKVKDWV